MSRVLVEAKESAKCKVTRRTFHVRGKSRCKGPEIVAGEEVGVTGAQRIEKSSGKQNDAPFSSLVLQGVRIPKGSQPWVGGERFCEKSIRFWPERKRLGEWRSVEGMGAGKRLRLLQWTVREGNKNEEEAWGLRVGGRWWQGPWWRII